MMGKNAHVGLIDVNECILFISTKTADCPNSCDEHCSECVSPDECTCDPGWTGTTCCTGMYTCVVVHSNVLLF